MQCRKNSANTRRRTSAASNSNSPRTPPTCALQNSSDAPHRPKWSSKECAPTAWESWPISASPPPQNSIKPAKKYPSPESNVLLTQILEKFESPKSVDPWLKIDFNLDFFEGTIYYMEFDKENQDLNVQKAFIQLNKRSLKIRSEPSGAL